MNLAFSANEVYIIAIAINSWLAMLRMKRQLANFQIFLSLKS